MSKQGREQNRTERAAAIRAQQARQERNKKVGIVAVVLVVLGIIVAAGVWLGGGAGGGEEDVHADVPVRAGDHSLIIGEETAPTKVTVYEDFQCPFCREFEMASRDFLLEYADEGKVQVEYRPFNLLSTLPYSERALNAFVAVLETGKPEDALQLHDTLFDKQPYEQTSGSVSVDDIQGWVEDTGASDAVVEEAAEEHEQWFQEAARAAQAAGVQGTPTVLVNGEQLSGGNLSVSQMADQLEQIIAQAAE